MTAKREQKLKLCSGCKSQYLGYMQAHEEARQRMAKGERQTRCPVCGLWKWPHELKTKEPK